MTMAVYTEYIGRAAERGRTAPLGATAGRGGVNVSLFSKHATLIESRHVPLR